MAGIPVKSENIDVLRRTYLQLFSSILSRKSINTEQKRQIYKTLQSFLYEKVLKPDEFSNHIPDYAKILSVPDKALSDYLARNFQKALDHIKGNDQEKSSPAPSSEDGGSSGKKITAAESVLGSSKTAEFLHELIHSSGIQIHPGSRFVPLELGVMKFMEGGSETPGMSAEKLLSFQSEKALPSDAPASETKGPQIIKKTIPSRSEKKQTVLEKEKSIIDEMLNHFGNVLDIHGKLDPQIGPAVEAGPEIAYEGDAPASET
ncbi:MAG: hypothetical protein OEZ34_13370, partial [Spirochaetia bacterium]|nr:hypothetical protein [Spirochaetia bacterium]